MKRPGLPISFPQASLLAPDLESHPSDEFSCHYLCHQNLVLAKVGHKLELCGRKKMSRVRRGENTITGWTSELHLGPSRPLGKGVGSGKAGK